MNQVAKKESLAPAVVIGLIIVATMLAYWPSLAGGFLWDDDVHVTQNRSLKSAAGLASIWTHLGATPQYYPLTHTSFWIQHRIWENNPLPYRLGNVLLHIGSALILWRILLMLEIPGAWLAAAIFAIHPINVESVAWITERKNTLSGLFYMIGAWSLLRALLGEFDWQWYVVGVIAFLLALLSKTVAASLPAALMLIFWWKAGRLSRRQIVALTPLLIVGAAMGQLTAWMERTHVRAAGPEWDLSFAQRLMIAGRAIWFYVCKLLLPMGQSFIYPRWEMDTSQAIYWLFPIAVVLVIAVLWIARRRLGRGPLVATFFFIGTVFPALGFANIYPMRYSFVADHFVYLASIGLFVIVAAMLSRIGSWNFILLAVLAMLSWQRAGVFASSIALWTDTLEKNDRAWIAHDQLGSIAVDRQQFEEAAGHFLQAIAINPDHIEGYLGMGNVCLLTGQAPRAIEQIQQAVAVRPDQPITYYSLAGAFAAAGDFESAIQNFKKTLAVDSRFYPAHLKLSQVYDFLGRRDEAALERAEFQRALRADLGYDLPLPDGGK